MEVGDWFQRLLPKVEAYGHGSECLVATLKTRTAAHNPPLYWLGRALDAVEAGGALDRVRARLLAAHGAGTCSGPPGDEDQRAQDALTEACAYAWAGEYLGPPQFVEADGGERLLVHVPSVDAYLAPRRLRPDRQIEALLRQVQQHAEGAAADLPEGRARILYLNVNLVLDFYAQEVGYRLERTEPVGTWLKHHAAEQRLGWVLTRPFEWGVPIEAWY